MTTQPPIKQPNPSQQGLFSDKAFAPDVASDLINQPASANVGNLADSSTARLTNKIENNEDIGNTNLNKTVAKTAHPSKLEAIKAKLQPSAGAETTGEPLKLAVVGHTNTGKTSILRTLLRDMYFGEVKNEAATTRHVEQALLSDSQTGAALVALYDTPGLEDASGLMDWLEDNTASRRDGIERLQQFLASSVANSIEAAQENTYLEDYSQEAKVIRQLLASDMAIYVIDAREPVLGKYKDELAILSWAAIPVMPVFNFTDSADARINANVTAWQTMLARRNLHISTQFDSVAFEFDDEITLWRNLATMVTPPYILERLIERRMEDWAQLYEQALIIIADFLINMAACVREIQEEDDPLPVLTEMQEAVRQSERMMQSDLLNLYKFYDNTAVATPLKLSEYQQDPFDPELLKSYGLRTTSGAAAGALLGLGIDAAALGTTLGLGAALGGLAGGLLSNTSSIADKLTGVKRLYIDPATLTLLATRSLDLLASLRHRGHAATPDSPVLELQAHSTPPWAPNKLPSELKKARSKPNWSGLNGGKTQPTAELRADAAWALSEKLKR